MGNLFETIYDVLFQPRAALRAIAVQKKIGPAFVVVLLSVILPMWAVYLGFNGAGTAGTLGVIMLAQLVASLVFWVLGTAVLHFIAEILGGHGTALGLLAALGFAHFPRIFIVPAWVVASLLPDGAALFFLGAVGLALGLWMLYLNVVAISEAHELTRSKAVVVLFTPLLLAVAAVIGLIMLVSMAAVHWSLGLS